MDLIRFFEDAGDTLVASGITSGLDRRAVQRHHRGQSSIYATDAIQVQYTVGEGGGARGAGRRFSIVQSGGNLIISRLSDGFSYIIAGEILTMLSAVAG